MAFRREILNQTELAGHFCKCDDAMHLEGRRLFSRVFLSLIFSVALTAYIFAQDIAPPAPKKLVIHSKMLNEDREIWVRMPAGVKSGRFPVLYLTDGEAHINEISSTMDFLASVLCMPPMIAVGIVNTDRTRDLTPTHADIKISTGRTFSTPTSGGADKFLDFIQTELIPQIEKEYPTQPYRVFAGHSLGGLLAFHTMITRPDLFNAYIAVSPALQWDDKRTLKQTLEFFAAHKEFKKTLFFSLADEAGPMRDAFDQLLAALKSHAPQGLSWESAQYTDEDHASVVLRAHYAGLRTVFTGFKMHREPEIGIPVGGLKGVEEHYRELSTKYGFPVSAESAINNLGYVLIGARRPEKAVAAFQRNVELYPRSPDAYDSLADGYEAVKKLDLAQQAVKKAIELGKQANDPDLALFQKHLTQLEAKVEGSKAAVH